MNASMQCSCIRVGLHPRFVGLYTQPSKDIHHCRFSGLLEGSQGYVLGLGKKGFGLSHVGLGGLGQGKFSISRLCYRRCYSMKFSY